MRWFVTYDQTMRWKNGVVAKSAGLLNEEIRAADVCWLLLVAGSNLSMSAVRLASTILICFPPRPNRCGMWR